LKELVIKVEDYNQTAEIKVEAVQIKEKFGGLRFYTHPYVEEVEQLIINAERKAAITCEKCGMPGQVGGTGWIKTLCNNCRKENGR
jgi:hypothetical protein